MILVFAWVLFLVIYKACQAQAIIEGLINGEPVETLLAKSKGRTKKTARICLQCFSNI